MQISEQYKVKEASKRKSEINFRPFPLLDVPNLSLEERVSNIKHLIVNGNANAAISQSLELMKLSLKGLHYLQRYDWLFLRSIVTSGFLGWSGFLLVYIMDAYVLHESIPPKRSKITILATALIGGTLALVFWMQNSPISYYAYGFFPVFFWEETIARRNTLTKGINALIHDSGKRISAFQLGLRATIYILGLEFFVFGYFHREIFSACLVIAAFWPATFDKGIVVKRKYLCLAWVLCCLAMSLFTMLPVVKQENLLLIQLGGLSMVILGLFYLKYGYRSLESLGYFVEKGSEQQSKGLLIVQILLIVLSMVITQSSVMKLRNKEGLPLLNQIMAWLTLIASITVPFLHTIIPHAHHFLHRLAIIFLAFSPTFVLLSISYEGLFYVTFYLTLVLWVQLEYENVKSQIAPGKNGEIIKTSSFNTKSNAYRALNIGDTRIALFFFFLLQIAFFGTGNIASISSFSLDSVYRLYPVFDPFIQGAILLFKLLVPFSCISANLGILNKQLHVPPSSLFTLVLIISDVLTLNFFYLVRDSGSWLEIGTSISHFCIANLLCLFIIGLEYLSEIIISRCIGFGYPESTDKVK